MMNTLPGGSLKKKIDNRPKYTGSEIEEYTKAENFSEPVVQKTRDKHYEDGSPILTAEERENSTVGLRFTGGKLDWDLIEMKALEPMVRAMMYGAKKYARYNWKKGIPLETLVSCMQRHLIEMKEGDALDVESMVEHVGHLLANAMMYSYFQNVRKSK